MLRHLYYQLSVLSVHHSKFENSHRDEGLANQNQILSMHPPGFIRCSHNADGNQIFSTDKKFGVTPRNKELELKKN